MALLKDYWIFDRLLKLEVCLYSVPLGLLCSLSICHQFECDQEGKKCISMISLSAEVLKKVLFMFFFFSSLLCRVDVLSRDRQTERK